MTAESGSLPIVELVGGARPNFVKLAPLYAALEAGGALSPRVVHTGQHYDARLSGDFFAQLNIPAPTIHLAVGSGSHGVQTARVLERYEAHLVESPPQAVVVFGDVNSTLAAGLAASKLHIPVAHVEAGLRSGDRRMPEEINRILTDALADRHYVTEPAGQEHLLREGVAAERIVVVGNTMIDTLRHNREAIDARERAAALGIEGPYGVITMHRPANVDDPACLTEWLQLFRELAESAPMVFPIHPRTRVAAEAAGLADQLHPHGGWHPVHPEAYLDHLSLLAGASVVLTDSGGMQEECAYLGVPCVVLRDSTERPLTLDVGACRLAGADRALVREWAQEALRGDWPPIGELPLWDGQAGERIAADLAAWLGAE